MTPRSAHATRPREGESHVGCDTCAMRLTLPRCSLSPGQIVDRLLPFSPRSPAHFRRITRYLCHLQLSNLVFLPASRCWPYAYRHPPAHARDGRETLLRYSRRTSKQAVCIEAQILCTSYIPKFPVLIAYVLEPAFTMRPSSRSVAFPWLALTVPRSTATVPLSPLQKLPKL